MPIDVFDHIDTTELRIRSRGADDLTALIDDTVDYEQPHLRRRGRSRKQPDHWE